MAVFRRRAAAAGPADRVAVPDGSHTAWQTTMTEPKVLVTGANGLMADSPSTTWPTAMSSAA